MGSFLRYIHPDYVGSLYIAFLQILFYIITKGLGQENLPQAFYSHTYKSLNNKRNLSACLVSGPQSIDLTSAKDCQNCSYDSGSDRASGRNSDHCKNQSDDSERVSDL